MLQTLFGAKLDWSAACWARPEHCFATRLLRSLLFESTRSDLW